MKNRRKKEIREMKWNRDKPPVYDRKLARNMIRKFTGNKGLRYAWQVTRKEV